MKIYERIVLDWDGNVLEEQSFEYEGPVDECKGGGKGSIPKAPPPAPKPAVAKGLTAATTNAVDAQDEKRKKYLGQQGTILTSALGAQQGQQQGKTLLGQ
jgi:hypothetical protein